MSRASIDRIFFSFFLTITFVTKCFCRSAIEIVHGFRAARRRRGESQFEAVPDRIDPNADGRGHLRPHDGNEV